MGLSPMEKERLLKALESDREFRYALMGLLGYREVLERTARLEERMMKLEERFADLEDRFLKLEERVAKLEERFAELAERQQKLDERMARLESEMIETRRVVTVIAHRFGVLSEAGLREALKYVVQEVLGAATVERKVFRDDEGIVYGHSTNVEIDVVVRDREHILVEVKSRVSRGDLAELYRIGQVYEKKYGVKPRLLMIGGFIDPEAYTTAHKLKIDLKPITRTE